MSIKDIKTTVTTKVKVWAAIISFLVVFVSATYSLVGYAKDKMEAEVKTIIIAQTSHFATNDSVYAVQRQTNNMYIHGQVDMVQEKIHEINDKIIDGTASSTDRKKLPRLEVQKFNLNQRIIQ